MTFRIIFSSFKKFFKFILLQVISISCVFFISEIQLFSVIVPPTSDYLVFHLRGEYIFITVHLETTETPEKKNTKPLIPHPLEMTTFCNISVFIS